MSLSSSTAATLATSTASTLSSRYLNEAQKKAYELAMTVIDEPGHLQGLFFHIDPVDFPPTYAELQKKCGDVITQCRAVNVEVRLLEEKIMALKGDTFLENLHKAYKPSVKKLQIEQQAKPYDYFSEDGEFPPRQDFRKAGIPPSAIVPQTAERQPIVDTSVLAMLHTTRHNPAIYASRGQQRFPSPPTPVIPQVRAYEPVVHSSSRSSRQRSVPQPGQPQDSSNSLRPVKNAPSVDAVLGVMSPTRRYPPRYTPIVEQQSPPASLAARASSQSSGQVNKDAQRDPAREFDRPSAAQQ
ncbi:hypothetical protein BDZ89DRAFT_1167681 [Hymenopellis radicata]|nr:hypothetical protein BDZ89DRAFT_1167681 [Hymenopellis radicata]